MASSQHEMTPYPALPSSSLQSPAPGSPLYPVIMQATHEHDPPQYVPQSHGHVCANCGAHAPATSQGHSQPTYYNFPPASPNHVALASDDSTSSEEDSTRPSPGIRITLIVLASLLLLLVIVGFIIYGTVAMQRVFFMSIICPPISHGIGLLFGIWQLVASIIGGKNLTITASISPVILLINIAVTVLTMIWLPVYGAVLVPYTLAFGVWMIIAFCSVCKCGRH